MFGSPDFRALYFLGRRVERLILAGILLVVLCFVETYLTTANSQFVKDRSASTVKNLLNRLQAEEQRLTILFNTKVESQAPRRAQSSATAEERTVIAETRRKLGLPRALPTTRATPPPKPESYRDVLDSIVAEVAKSSHMRADELATYIDLGKSPAEMVKSLQKQNELLDNKPTTVWGIQTPRLLQVQYAGLDYKIPFGFLSSVLAIALAPLIIGWLGALYVTRQRELAMIVKLEDYKLAFPHILNFLPVVFASFEQRFESSQKLRMKYILRMTNRFVQGMFRSCAILLVALPLVSGFAYSLFQLWEVETEAVSFLFHVGAFLLFVMAYQTIVLLGQDWLFLYEKQFYE